MLFTRENAREMSRKGNAVRWSQPRTPPPQPAIPAPIPEPSPATPDTYLSARLVRVRLQLSLIDSAIEREAATNKPDGQRLNWLASAQERLAEQERMLAGRPSPGSLRPSAPGKRATSAPAPLAGPWIPPDPPAPAAQAEQPSPPAQAATDPPAATPLG